MIATLYMQPGCIESLSAAAVLAEHRVPFQVRDVRHDEDAAVEVVDWYREERPDSVPATPVVVLAGGEVCFGAMHLHAALSGHGAVPDLAVAA
ncbi:glutaredoxin domain-containing protein [Mycobacteroides abscessus]|uniref:glutaredoxin domain-containing protein n=1 Tax=Mycobacteroides abscessus TaxID=36809 RepID=UPI00266F107C|nr:glutaredoxin domain-containing protein [Mycobacteroides abscessus]MDO3110452.1 glutaredoxin domain-containing protein [Mycobacteroides abscessus subsp. abscessus]